MHDMKTVSLSSGGELRDYDLVAYVAKDASGSRGASLDHLFQEEMCIMFRRSHPQECHVFDCGSLSDEVLTTLGQAFVLAQVAETIIWDALILTLPATPGRRSESP